MANGYVVEEQDGSEYVVEEDPLPGRSTFGAITQGAAQFAKGAFPFVDEATALTAAYAHEGDSSRYGDYLNQIRSEDRQFQSDHPVASTGLQIAGMLNPYSLYGKIGKALAGTVEGVGALANIKRAGVVGGGVGAVQGFDEGQGSLGDRLISAGETGLIGGALGGGITGVGQAARGTYRAGKGLVDAARDLGTEAGQNRLVGSALTEASGNPNLASTLDEAIAGNTGPYAQYRTTDEILGNAGLAAARRGAASANPAVGAEAVARGEARSAARNQAVNALYEGGVPSVPSKDELGARILKELDAPYQASKAAVREAYGQIDPEGTSQIPLRWAKGGMTGLRNKYYGGLGGNPPADLDALMEEIAQTKGPISWDELSKARGRVSQSIAEAARAGDERGLAYARGMRDQLDGAADIAVKQGGFDETSREALATGIGLRAKQGATFERGTAGNILGRTSKYREAPSRIPGEVLKTPEGLDQTLSITGRGSETSTGLRETVLSGMKHDLERGNSVSVSKYLTKNEPTLRRLFDPEEISTVRAAAEDLERETRARASETAVSRGNSATSQTLSTISFLKDRLGLSNPAVKVLQMTGKAGRAGGNAGALGAGYGIGSALSGFTGIPGLGLAGGLLGVKAQTAADKIDTIIMRKFSESLLDPNVAKEMLKAPTKESVTNVLRASHFDDKAIAQIIGSMSASVVSGPPPEHTRTVIRQVAPSRATTSSTPTPAPSRSTNQMQLKKTDVSALADKHAGEGPLSNLVQAVIDVESRGETRAVSKAGAKGLMQLMPAMQRSLGVSDPFNPDENVRGGVKLLKEELDRFGDIRLALAAYNAGSPNVRRAIQKAGTTDWAKVRDYLPNETKAYPSKVLAAQRQLA